MPEHRIRSVDPNGIAMEMGVEPGMALVSINGERVLDIFDYRTRIAERNLTVEIRDLDGTLHTLEIERDEDEEFGVEFENPFLDEYRSCSNRCIFCFVDQMPKGLRPTLYFKDDDARLSFLQGNYVTLTNLSDKEMERILSYRMEPINISIHTTDPELRCRMLGNRFAGEALKRMDDLKEHGLHMNGQIVLCKGWNDGPELSRTLERLSEYRPELVSVSVVPAGITKYREGLTKLEGFTKEEARAVLKQIRPYAHFVYASDEFYFLAGEEVPSAEEYDGYPQFENGVGMVRSFLDELSEELKARREELAENFKDRHPRVSLACGMLMAQVFTDLSKKLRDIDLLVRPIRNDFFGETITVTGLLTGQDMKNQLEGTDLGERLLISASMTRTGEEVFLDDMTVQELSDALKVPIVGTGHTAKEFVDALYYGGPKEE